jgi:peptidoglycan/LPS O-acetylase OafA/YrhL
MAASERVAISAPGAKEHAAAVPRLRRWLSLSLLANNFPELHGLRVVAILGVLQFHVTTNFHDAGVSEFVDWIRFSMSIFFGMDLFFVLSGFLIGTMILHALAAEKKQRPMRFYARRSFRIFPLYYVVLTALYFLLPLNPTQKANVWKEYAYLTNTVHPLERFTVVMNYGWSLCVEEQFYLAAPLLIAVLARMRGHASRLAFLGIVWASAGALRLWVVHHATKPWNDDALFQAIYVRTHTRFDTLIAGVVLAYVNFHFEDRIKAMFREAKWRRVFGVTAIVSLWILLFPRVFGDEWYWDVRALSFGSITSVMYVAYVLLLLHGDAWGKKLFSARPFLYAATLGYGIYLVHMPLFDYTVLPIAKRMIGRWGMTMVLVWPLSLAMLWIFAAAIAYVLHLLVEKPALKLRDRFAP